MDELSQSPDNSLDGQQGTGAPATGGGESLESNAGATPPGQTISTGGTPGNGEPPHKDSALDKIKGLWKKINVYFLLFALLMIVAVIVVIVTVLKNNTSTNNQSGNNASISSQNLTNSTLQELAKNSVTVGDPKQVLNVESNAVFQGTVLVRGDLQVAGTIKAGGSISLPGISVSGSSTFGQVQVKTLAISGDTTMQGSLAIQNSLSVNGNGTFNGAVTAGTIRTSNLQLTGVLALDSHIAAGGPIPSSSGGGALGAGGTSSISGSDTAGSISIHTGSAPGGGCFVSINFTSAFSTTPHVIVTPIGSAAAGLSYYVNRSTTQMSVCTISAAPAGQSFGFDYIVFD